MGIYAGIDFGGTNLAVSIVDDKGTELAGNSQPSFPADLPYWDRMKQDPRELVGRAAEAVRAAMAEAQVSALDGVGAAVPGLVASPDGPVTYAPSAGWQDVDVAALLTEELGAPVTLANDAVCGSVSEARVGAGQGLQSFLYVTLGTGIGAAFVWEGSPWSQHGQFGSELGHIPLRAGGLPCSCGLPGCWQQYASATALRRQAIEASRGNPACAIQQLADGDEDKITCETVFRAAELSGGVAKHVIDTYCGYVAEGIGGLVNIFWPEAVVIGGGLSNAGEALFGPIREKLPHYVHASQLVGSPEVRQSQLPDRGVARGAAFAAQDRFAAAEGA